MGETKMRIAIISAMSSEIEAVIDILDKTEKKNENGKISIARYASVTFPVGTYNGLSLNSYNEEDCLVYGEVEDVVEDVKGQRISDLMKRYPKSGMIQSVNDNSNRDFCKNIKVVVA